MIWELLNQHRPISYLVLMQSTVVGFGTLATGMMLKIWRSAVEEGHAVYSPISIFVRDFGFLFLLVPATWAVLAIYLIRRGEDDSVYIASGVGLLIFLLGFFCFTACVAVRFHVITVM